MRLVLPILLAATTLSTLAGCNLAACNAETGGDAVQQPAPDHPAAAMNLELPTVSYAWDPQAGDPSVSAEMGGPGFTGEGWTTKLEGFRLGNPEAPQGGTLVTDLPDWPATLRQAGENWNQSFNYFLTPLIYDTLLDLDPVTLEYRPKLATHWQLSPDHKTYRFRINPAARWSDGKEITADDVVATFKLLLDPTLRDPGAAISFEKLGPVKAVSKYIVEATVSEDNWRVFLDFAQQHVLPAHEIGNLTGSEYLDRYQFAYTVVSGPYEVKPSDIDSGNSITVTRRKDWWADSNPYWDGWYNIEKYKFVVIKDPQLRFEKIKKHEIDWMIVPKAQWWAEDIPVLDAVQRGLLVPRKLFTDAPVGTQGIAINTTRPPLDDLRIREALQYLYDRETMNDKLFYHEYEPFTSYYQGGVYANPTNELIPYDEVKAVSLLEEAGWTQKNAEGYRVKNGQELQFTVSYRTQLSERSLSVFQESAKRAGIRLDLQLVTPASGWKNLQDREYQLSETAWGANLFPATETTWHSKLAATKSNNNVTAFADPKVDALCDQYAREYDVKKRAEIVRQIDKILYEAHPYVLGWYGPSQRILYWNKFGMPEWGSTRFAENQADRFLTHVWWVDQDKERQLAAAEKDPSVKMPLEPKEVRFWPAWDAKYDAGGQGTQE